MSKKIISGSNDNEQREERLEGTDGALTSAMFIERLPTTLPTGFLNRFRLQFRLLHSEVPSEHSSNKFYPECQPAFTEELIFQDVHKNETNRNQGQKRTIEIVYDDGNAYGI
jgi:hypothetical protein